MYISRGAVAAKKGAFAIQQTLSSYLHQGGMRMTNYSVLRHPVLHDEAVKRYGTVRRGFMFFLELGASEAERRRSKLSRRPRG